jgi:hypothetical protein
MFMVAMGLYQKEQMLICLPRLMFRKEGSDEGVGYLWHCGSRDYLEVRSVYVVTRGPTLLF